MILTVTSDNFVETLNLLRSDSSGTQAVFFSKFSLPQGGSGYRLSYAVPMQHMIVVTDLLFDGRTSFSPISGQAAQTGDADFDALVEALKTAGFIMMPGYWTDYPEPMISEPATARAAGGSGQAAGSTLPSSFFVVAISYLTSEEEVGLWVDAFPTKPAEDEALQAMFQEFVASGDLAGTSFSEFFEASAPNVEFINSDDINAWLERKN
ncbi:MAG: hypothetical protein WCO51_00750 [bacterium]|jgi:hypothetical protein